MRKWTALFFLFLVQPLFGEVYEIPPVKGQISDYYSSNLPDEFAVKAENVYCDKDLGVRKRFGYDNDNVVSFGSATIADLWPFIDVNSNQYLVSLSSNVLRYTQGNSSWSVISSSLPTGVDWDATAALGNLWVVSRSSAMYWTGVGNAVQVSSGLPLGAYIESFRNRLAVAGASSNPSILYLSRHLDGDNWTVGGNAVEPVQFTIGIKDGDVITGLKAVANGLLIFKRKSTWILSGHDQEDFEVNNISQVIGCVQDRSIQEKQGKIYWISKRGVERLTLNKLFQTAIKEGDIELLKGNETLTDQILSGYDVTTINSVSDTSQSDFSLGSSTYTDLTRAVDSISVSSPTLDFSTSTPFPFAEQFKFYDNVFGDQGAVAFRFTPKFNCKILGAKLHLVYSAEALSPPNALHTQMTFSLQSGATEPDSGVALTVADDYPTLIAEGPAVTSATFAPFVNFSTGNHLTAGTSYWVVMDPLRTGGSASSSMKIYTQAFSSGDALGVQVATTVGISPGPVDWDNVKNGCLASVILSSAQWISSIKNLGTSIARFQYFTSNYSLGGAALTFYVRSASNEAGVLAAPWILQVVGATIAAPTNTYIQTRVDFQLTVATQNPVVQDISVSYVDSASKQRVVSWVNDDRYYLSHTTSSASGAVNDQVYVLDQFDNVTMLRGIYAASYAQGFGKEFFGSSLSSGPRAGFVWYFNTSFSDGGTPINAFIETKDYCGKDCFAEKLFDSFYIKTLNPGTGSGTLMVQAQFDNDGTYGSMGFVSLTERSGLITAVLPFALGSNGVYGRTVRYHLSNNELGQDFRFYGGRIYYDTIPTPYDRAERK